MTETDVNTTTEEDDLDPLDREALERAMKLASRDPGRRWQLNSKLQDEFMVRSRNLRSVLHAMSKSAFETMGRPTLLGQRNAARLSR